MANVKDLASNFCEKFEEYMADRDVKIYFANKLCDILQDVKNNYDKDNYDEDLDEVDNEWQNDLKFVPDKFSIGHILHVNFMHILFEKVMGKKDEIYTVAAICSFVMLAKTMELQNFYNDVLRHFENWYM